MKSGRDKQLTKQVGEYLAAAELSRLGFIATTFTGNVPDFDILAINSKFETIPIQVKAVKEGDWQFKDASSKFLDILISDKNVQTLKSMKALKDPELICVYVKLDSYGKDQFYIFKLKELQKIIFDRYKKHLEAKKGVRPRNPQSKHVNVTTDDLSNYEDNWELYSLA